MLPNKYAIYRFLNIVNNKSYVGQDSRSPSRKYQHIYSLKKNKHHSKKFQRAWNKYGPSNFVFEILEYVEDFNDLVVKEQHWMDKLDAVRNGYNNCPAAGSCKGIKFGPQSPEQRAKTSAALKGRKFSPEHLKNISKGRKGLIRSEDHCKKLSIALKGRKKTPEHLAKISSATKGLKKSPDHLEKTVSALKKRNDLFRSLPPDQRKLSPEHRAAITAGLKEAWKKRKSCEQS